MTVQEQKIHYNQLLDRYIRAETYMDNQTIPIPTREKYVPVFQDIMRQLSFLLNSFEKQGIEIEPLKGFDVA